MVENLHPKKSLSQNLNHSQNHPSEKMTFTKNASKKKTPSTKKDSHQNHIPKKSSAQKLPDPKIIIPEITSSKKYLSKKIHPGKNRRFVKMNFVNRIDK